MAATSEELLSEAQQARRENRLDDAKRATLEAIDLCGPAKGLPFAAALTGLGQIERDQRNFGAAAAHYEEAVAIYRAQDDPLRLAHTIRHLADIQVEAGRLDLAEPGYREALEIYRSHESTKPLDLANTLRGYALLKELNSDREQARLFWGEAREIYISLRPELGRHIEPGIAECDQRLRRIEQ